MSCGVVTFFKYNELGFYKYKKEDGYCEPLEMPKMLDSLHTWFQEKVSLEDTLLWDDDMPGFSHKKKVYLKSMEYNQDTGDYILILWRAIGRGNGVYGIRADSKLDDDKLYNADDAVEKDTKVIWGEAAYYWFVPRLNIFASIRFQNSIADTDMMNGFLKDFICLHSNLKQKVREVKTSTSGHTYTSVHFKSTNCNENLWFRISSKQYTKLTTAADLGQIAKDITHFVKREVISARDVQEHDWTRFFKGLPFVSCERNKQVRKIEINIDANPTESELRNIFESYNEEYNVHNSDWRNLGFKKEGVGGICWLDQFVVKSVLNVNDDSLSARDSTGHYTTERLYTALHLKRDSLLAPFNKSEVEIALANG